MPVQGAFGTLEVFEDFQAVGAESQIADATAGTRYNDLCLVAVSGTIDITHTVDESGGVAAFDGGGGAADGVAIVIGSPMQPSTNGPIVMEARFKQASATDFRCFVGFQETVSLSETVNPFTLSGTTLTANNGGQVAGFYTDMAATTDDFRYLLSSDGTAQTTATVYTRSGKTTLGSLGVRASVTPAADSWYVARVQINPDGSTIGWFGHTSQGQGDGGGLIQIARTVAGSVDQTALYFPVLQLLATSTGDGINECDYVAARGKRDWAA